MVHSVLCDIHSGSTWVGPCDFWLPLGGRRASYGGMVLVLRLLYGNVHWKFRGRAGISISNRWRDVFCHKACRA